MTAPDGPRFALSIDLAEPAIPVELPRHGVAMVLATFAPVPGRPETDVIGCAHDLHVGAGRLTGLVDLRGGDVFQAQRVIADHYADLEPRLLACFVTAGFPARRRLLSFRHVGVAIADSGPLELISTTGARSPRYHATAYAARHALPPPPKVVDLEPIWITNAWGNRERLA